MSQGQLIAPVLCSAAGKALPEPAVTPAWGVCSERSDAESAGATCGSPTPEPEDTTATKAGEDSNAIEAGASNETAYAEEFLELKAETRRQVQGIRKSLDSDLKAWKKHMARVRRDHNDMLERVRKNHKQLIKKQLRMHRAETEMLRDQHTAQVKKYERDAEDHRARMTESISYGQNYRFLYISAEHKITMIAQELRARSIHCNALHEIQPRQLNYDQQSPPNPFISLPSNSSSPYHYDSDSSRDGDVEMVDSD